MRLAILLAATVLALASCGEPSAYTGDAAPETGAVLDGAPDAPRLRGSGSAVTEPERKQATSALPDVPAGRAERDPSRDIEVWVTDSRGNAVAGARVSHPCSNATTDAEGHAWLGPTSCDFGSPSGDRYWKTLTVCAEGYATLVLPGELSFIPPIHEGRAARVRLEPSRRLSGRVTDTRGRAVAGVGLVAEAGEYSRHKAVTDEEGRFVFDGQRQRPIRVLLRSHDWIAKDVRVVPPATDLEITAYRTCWIKGKVTVGQGERLPADTRVQIEGVAWDTDLRDGFTLACPAPRSPRGPAARSRCRRSAPPQSGPDA